MASLRTLLYCFFISASIASPVSNALAERDDSDNPSLDGFLTFPQGEAFSCSVGQQTIIQSAFADAMYLAGQRGAGGNFAAPDWTKADFDLAHTWFGALGNVDRKSKHRTIANNLQRMSNPRWLYKSKDLPSADRFIEVYCPTPGNSTVDKNGKKTCQFGNNPASLIDVGFAEGSTNKYPWMNLCPTWFTVDDVHPVLMDMEVNPSHRGTLAKLYRTKGVLILHELHHIQYKEDNDGVFRSGLTAPQCIDQKVEGMPGVAYGPMNAKWLAKNHGVQYTLNNVDNYVCFILASYIKDTWGDTPDDDAADWVGFGSNTKRNSFWDPLEPANSTTIMHTRQDDGTPFLPDPADEGSLQPIDEIVTPPMSETTYDLLTFLDHFITDAPPAPTCYGSSSPASASRPYLSNLITNFCSSISSARLSVGCLDLPDPYLPIQTFNYSLTTGLEDVAVGISVSYDPSWQGSGPLMTIEEDCEEMLGVALDGCDTDSVSAKRGGTVRDMGRIYDLAVHTTGNPGDADWKPTDQFAAAGGCKAV